MQLNVAGKRCHVGTGGQPFDPARSPQPPLLLVHGAANDRDCWRTVAGGLSAAGCAVLAADLPGHGLSAGPALRSIEELADWLPALLDAVAASEHMVDFHSRAGALCDPGRVVADARGIFRAVDQGNQSAC